MPLPPSLMQRTLTPQKPTEKIFRHEGPSSNLSKTSPRIERAVHPTSTQKVVPKPANSKSASSKFVRPKKEPNSTEDVKLQHLLQEANRHRAAAARVSHLSDFQALTFTLPAGKDKGDSTSMAAETTTPQKSELIPQKRAGYQNKIFGKQETPSSARRPRQMFRGTKSCTSSAAAGSFAEGQQADRYYHQVVPQSRSKRLGRQPDDSIPDIRNNHIPKSKNQATSVEQTPQKQSKSWLRYWKPTAIHV